MIMRQEETSGLTLRIPWDSNTFRGFVFALCITGLWLFLSRFLDADFAHTNSLRDSTTQKTIPLELVNLRLGAGNDGRGSSGNMTEEGVRAKGEKLNTNFDPASAPKQSDHRAVTKGTTTPDLTTRIVPVKNVADHPDKDKKKANSDENTSTKKTSIPDNSTSITKGDPKGSDNGTGLGDKGIKAGKGLGWLSGLTFDNGGNRVAVSTPSLQVPAGVTTSTKIKIRFRVSPNGDVIYPMPVQRGEPRLEQIAIDAIKRLKFNRIEDEKGDMVGSITVTFNIN